MATKETTKKATTKKAPKAVKVTYKGAKYEVLDRNEHKVMLTDGLIHFWVRAEDIDGE